MEGSVMESAMMERAVMGIAVAERAVMDENQTPFLHALWRLPGRARCNSFPGCSISGPPKLKGVR